MARKLGGEKKVSQKQFEESVAQIDAATKRPNKPVVHGPVNSNVFAVLGATNAALKKAGLPDQATECSKKVFAAGSYDEALVIMSEYVEFDL